MIVMVRASMPLVLAGRLWTRRCGTLAGVPVPSRKLKDQVEDELDHYASVAWPQLTEVAIRWHGGYGYVTGHLSDDEDDEGLALCRIGYLGSAEVWQFAIYQASDNSYHDSVLPSGAPTGTPQEALDCACNLYLADSPI